MSTAPELASNQPAMAPAAQPATAPAAEAPKRTLFITDAAAAFARVKLEQRGTPLDLVIELHADRQELVLRMLRRAKAENRVDDNPETIAQRMEVYDRQTSPLLEYYRQQGKLVSIDAFGSQDEVFERIRQHIEAKRVSA